jgi:hypothetical protein
LFVSAFEPVDIETSKIMLEDLFVAQGAGVAQTRTANSKRSAYLLFCHHRCNNF